MKRLLVALSLFAVGSVAHAGQGQSNSLYVSSGTYLQIQGFGNNAGHFVQGVGIADSSYTITAPVDPVTGLEVQLATGTATFGSIANTSFAATQSGVYQVEPGSNTFRAAIQNTPAFTQSGVFQVEPGTNTFRAAIQNTPAVSQFGAWQVEPGTNTFKAAIQNTVTINSPAVTQSGVFQVEPGTNTFRTAIENSPTIANTSFIATQTTDASLNASCSIKGSSNAVNVSQFGGSNVIQSGTAGEPRISCDINGSSNTVSASVSASVVNITTATFGQPWPVVGVAVGAANGANMQMLRVDTSSSVYTNLNEVGGSAVLVSGTAGEQRVSCDINGSSNTVSATVTASVVNITTATYGTAFPATGSAIGGVNGNGTMQAFHVDVASDVYVTIAGTPTASVTGTVTANQGTTGTSAWLVDYSTGVRVHNLPSDLSTFPAYSVSTNTLTVAASATDIACLWGNASNTLMVYGLAVSCTQTTAGSTPITILKRSTANTGAWSTGTVVSQDSSYSAYVSTSAFYTANPTVGTLVGFVDDYSLGCMAPATATPSDIYMAPPNWKMKPIILRGVTQGLCVNLNAKTVTGGLFNVSYQYIETSTP